MMATTSISSASKSVGGPASILTEECMKQFNNTVKFVSDNVRYPHISIKKSFI